MKKFPFYLSFLCVFLLNHNAFCQDTTEGSGEEGSGTESGEGSTTEGTVGTTEDASTSTTTTTTTTTTRTTTITQISTTLQQVSCCTPQQLGEIILLIIQLLIIEGIIEGPGLGGSSTTTTPISISTDPNIPIVPGAAVIPGGPLDDDDNRISLTQISGVTSLPISIDNISPPIIDLNRFLPFYIFSLHFKNFIVTLL